MFGEAREESVEIVAGELPGKWLGDLLVTLPEGEKVFGQLLRIGEVSLGVSTLRATTEK